MLPFGPRQHSMTEESPLLPPLHPGGLASGATLTEAPKPSSSPSSPPPGDDGGPNPPYHVPSVVLLLLLGLFNSMECESDFAGVLRTALIPPWALAALSQLVLILCPCIVSEGFSLGKTNDIRYYRVSIGFLIIEFLRSHQGTKAVRRSDACGCCTGQTRSCCRRCGTLSSPWAVRGWNGEGRGGREKKEPAPSFTCLIFYPCRLA
jgi:hypothetical protein